MRHPEFPANYGRTADGRYYKAYQYLIRQNRKSHVPIPSWLEFLIWTAENQETFQSLFEQWQESAYPRSLLPILCRRDQSYGFIPSNMYWGVA